MRALQNYKLDHSYTIQNELTADNLMLLFRGEMMAIQVKNFYPKDITHNA